MKIEIELYGRQVVDNTAMDMYHDCVYFNISNGTEQCYTVRLMEGDKVIKQEIVLMCHLVEWIDKEI